MESILLVEDSREFQVMVRSVLNKEYNVVTASSAHEARDLVSRQKFALVLLDIVLPDEDGFNLCAEWQSLEGMRGTPIIFLTGKSGSQDKVRGLILGADDYIAKPFDPEELVARVHVKLRKKALASKARVPFGRYQLDLVVQKAFLSQPDGTVAELLVTTNEFRILSYLVNNASRTVPRQELSQMLWGSSASVHDRTVDKHISTLRRKLGGWARVESVRMKGYRIVESKPGPQATASEAG